MSEMLYVPVGEQEKAKKMGALFQRKSFFKENSRSYYIVSDSLSEEKEALVQSTYGEESVRERNAAKQLLSKWASVLKSGDKFDILRMAKDCGLPKDSELMGKLLLRLAERGEGLYPVSWEHFREFVPEFDQSFGIERYLRLHRDYHLEGDMANAIKLSEMPVLDKYFLYFIYEITDI